MTLIKRVLEKLASVGVKRYCSCGHVVSANLPVCPHCGARLADMSDFPID